MISRRQFLQYCSVAAGALGLSKADLLKLEEAMASPGAPSVIWLQGSACAGCSISFMNYMSSTAPMTAAQVVTESINLVYHQTLMSSCGESAVAMIDQAVNRGNFILVVEGGVPTAYGGLSCIAWTSGGREVTFLEAVQTLGAKASKIMCVGTCASFGGIPASGGNPAGIQSVSAATGKTTLNISGCPANPDWIVWAVVQLLAGNTIAVDASGRPTNFYRWAFHDTCPYKGKTQATTFGVYDQCMRNRGCRGPSARSNCNNQRWNNGRNWCLGAGHPCIGCTEPTFPGTNSFLV